MLGIMTIKVANTIGGIIIAVPSQVFLDGCFGGAVGLGGHDGFIAHDAGGGEFFFAKEGVED